MSAEYQAVPPGGYRAMCLSLLSVRSSRKVVGFGLVFTTCETTELEVEAPTSRINPKTMLGSNLDFISFSFQGRVSRNRNIHPSKANSPFSMMRSRRSPTQI